MIKANEIRVGNYTLLQRKICKIDGAHIKWLEDGTYIGHEPIPLTEDILLKCGFVFAEDFNAWQTPHDFHIRVEDSELKQKKKVFWIYFDEQEDHPITCIFELHQLQNLYFALTGEELIIII